MQPENSISSVHKSIITQKILMFIISKAKNGRKPKNLEKLYELLSQKTVTKKKKVFLERQLIKVPHYPQPIRVYKIFGDLILQDSMLSEVSTNCMVFNMNFFKKIMKITFDKSSSVVGIYLGNQSNTGPALFGLLINRLESLSDIEAKSLSSTLLKFVGIFGNFQLAVNNSFAQTLSENCFLDFEQIKSESEKKCLESLNLTNFYLVFNSQYNRERDAFEVYSISVSSFLLELLGYRLDDFIEKCFVEGLPSFFVFENYFAAVQTILQARLKKEQSFVKIKLITAEEEQVWGEAKIHNCHTINGGHFCASTVFEFYIYQWNLKQIYDKRKKVNEEDWKALPKENTQNVWNFMNSFYPSKIGGKSQIKSSFKN